MTTLSPSGGEVFARPPTMVDVARRCGVSLKTVSRVVNGEPRVSRTTTERVRSAITELGFTRNDGASLLRRGAGTASIGLVLEDLGGPFYAALAVGAERAARQRGHLLLTGSAEGDPVRARRLVEAFAARRVDGLLIAPTSAGGEVLAGDLPGRVPAVLLDRPSGDGLIDAVLTDNRGGIDAAVRHLAAGGHRRIAHLGDDPGHWTVRERAQGHRGSCRSLGLPAGEDLVHLGTLDQATLARVVRGWQGGPDPVTAIVTGNSRATVALLRHLQGADAGGGRPAHVGFDDLELADLLSPPLSAVVQDAAAIASRAVDLLFERITSPGAPARTLLVPTVLAVRGSSPPPHQPSRP